MGERHGNWRDWGKRLRAHVKEMRISWSSIADTIGGSESAVRHWCNGTRDINLVDFFRLCEAASADPIQILFGRAIVSDEQKLRLGQLVFSVLEADPAINPHYAPLVSEIRRDYAKKNAQKMPAIDRAAKRRAIVVTSKREK